MFQATRQLPCLKEAAGLTFKNLEKSFINVFRSNLISITEISRERLLQREHIEANEPKQLLKAQIIHNEPKESLSSHFHKRLSCTNSNPRSILRLYLEYTRAHDEIEYSWLVRCFCQLGNTFGFNSFWSTKDKQAIQSTITFKMLIHDLIERKHLLKAKHIPRILYSMSALEYRIWQIYPIIFESILENLPLWRTPTLAMMVLSLSLLGLDTEKQSTHTKLIETLIYELYDRSSITKTQNELNPFLYSGICFAITLLGKYEINKEILPLFLKLATLKLNKENLEHSGWVQFFLYHILYATDVEMPSNEVEIKQSIPIEIQQALYSRWLNEICIKGQPQGSEEMQSEVDLILKNLKENDALLNCSFGRNWDQQHAWFAGHLIKSRNLVLEYDYYQPIEEGRPLISGPLNLKTRLFKKFGLHIAIIHRLNWKNLDINQKHLEITRILANFPRIYDVSPKENIQDSTEKHTSRYLKHKTKSSLIWPPEKIII